MGRVRGLGRNTTQKRRSCLHHVAFAGLAVPLFLSACASTQTGTTTAALAPRPTPGAADAYGYAPVRVMSFSDGSRVALPTTKPDFARMTAARSATARETTATPAGAEAARVALKADVAERKAEQASLAVAVAAEVKDAVIPTPRAKPARTAAAETPAGRGASEATAETEDRPVAETATKVVATTIAAVSDGAEAVTTAALETTTKAVSAVGKKLDDTFKGTDTITGDARIDRLIEFAAAENGIPAELAYAVVRVESHYNPSARGSGVYGLSQIKPATARGLGFSGPTSALLDPETNLRYGMKYLAGAWQQGDRDVCRTAMKYKGGHRTTKMSRSAATYCSNVKRHMAAIERRRTPANQGTSIAATQRLKHVQVASMQDPVRTPATSAAASVKAAAPITAAAGSGAGRRISRSAAMVPGREEVPAFSLTPGSDTENGRGGRVRAALSQAR